MKKVQKKVPNGRCYAVVDGLGWKHYTKGFRKHSTHSNVVNRGSLRLFGFLAKANIKEDGEK